MIVVDANVAAYWLIEGEYTALARQLYANEPDWVVPALCRHELANVMASYVKHGGMAVADVPLLWESLESLIGGREYEVDFRQVIALAAEKSLSAYDAQYLYLAITLGVPLITQDRKLIGSVDTAFSMGQYLGEEDVI